jgi:DNA-binding SARP family transcriptional activator
MSENDRMPAHTSLRLTEQTELGDLPIQVFLKTRTPTGLHAGPDTPGDEMTPRFQVLGPFEIRAGDAIVPIGPRQRVVLAALLLNANQVVSTEHLIDTAWDEPVSAARSNLRTYIATLRRSLPCNGKPRVETHPSGYVLHAETDELDLLQFSAYAQQADRALHAGAVGTAASRLDTALELWRGRPLEGVAMTSALQVEATALEESRLAAVDAYVKAKLTMHEYDGLAETLRHLIEENPLRERLWTQLMLVLYRSGRKAEALAAYDEMRERIASVLAADPGPESRELMRRIAADDLC